MYKKLSNADKQRIIDSFNNKIEEYSKLTLDELKALYPSLGGAYKEACIQVSDIKLRELRETNLQELTDGTRAQTIDKNGLVEDAQIITSITDELHS